MVAPRQSDAGAHRVAIVLPVEQVSTVTQRETLVGEPVRLVQLVPLVQVRREADEQITGGGWEGSVRGPVALEAAPDQRGGRTQMPQALLDCGGAHRRDDRAEAVTPTLTQAQCLDSGLARSG